MNKRLLAALSILMLSSTLMLQAQELNSNEEQALTSSTSVETCCEEAEPACNPCCTSWNPNTGFSFGAFAGPTWAHGHVSLGQISFNTGYLVGATLGYKWCMGVEFEGEFAYRHNGCDHFRFNGAHAGIDGHIRSFSGMGNFKYYLPFDWYVVPFAGGGVGYADTKIIIDSLNGIKLNSRLNRSGFAWQVMAGLSTSYKCFDFDAEYRYFRGIRRTWYNSVDLAIKYYF